MHIALFSYTSAQHDLGNCKHESHHSEVDDTVRKMAYSAPAIMPESQVDLLWPWCC